MNSIRKRISLAAVLGLLFILLAGRRCLAADPAAIPVTMEVSSVYGNVGKLGSHVPLNVSLYGQSAAPFSGILSVSTLESRDDGGFEVCRYEYPVAVSTAETKKLRLYVPLGQKSREIAVILTDARGNKLLERRISFDISKEQGRLLIGVLSDESERLLYLDDVNLDYGMVQTEVLFLDETTLPSDARGLELLDVLLINHFDTDTLSDEQKEAISSWAKKGGLLLFGTGGEAKRTLGSFAGKFGIQEEAKARYEEVGMGVEYAKETPEDANVGMVCARFSLSGGEDVFVSDSIVLLKKAAFGKGYVGVFAFDLRDTEHFAKENPSYPIRLFNELLGENRIANLYFYSSYGGDEDYWNAQSTVNTGNADRLPNLPLYTAVLAFYLLTAGPGLYMLLKKRDLSRYYGGAVALFALAGSIFVYLIGSGTRFTSEFYTCATIADINENGTQAKELSYLNVRTPDSRPFSVQIPPEYQVTVLTQNSQWGGNGQEETLDGKRNWGMSLRFGEEGTRISVRDSRAFEPRLFKLERSGENSLDGKITSRLEYFDGRLSGTLTNEFPFPLEDGAILLYGQVLPLGKRIEPGETIAFSDEVLLTWPVGFSYLLSQSLLHEGRQETAAGNENIYLRSLSRTALYAYFIDTYYGRYEPKARLAAFGPATGSGEALAEGGQVVDSRTLYTAELCVSSTRDGLVYRSGLTRAPKVTSGSGTIYGNGMALYGTDPMAVEYFFDEALSIEKVSFLPISAEFLDTPDYVYMRLFDGEVHFYNYETRSYDAVDFMQVDFTAEELLPYLSAENSLLVRYTGQEDSAEGYSMLLPIPMVTGRER
ncbi:MAG: hypothetical protein HFE84_07850 [Lachnospiraceae bacterium]|nr:hypothetical protein [Lachnospiraceae bacterium]